MARIEDILAGRLHTHYAPMGTRASGYCEPSCGPCECKNCMHYDHGSCNHPVVMADKELDKNAHGDAEVEDRGWCKFFRNKSGKEGCHGS